jgi:hypothetical protein
MNACEQTRRYLDSYVDSELLVETSQDVLAHLDACSVCDAEVRVRTRLKSRLRSAVRSQDVPPALAAKVRRNIDRHKSMARAPHWALAAAAVAIVGGGIWVSLPGERLPALNDRPAQNAYIQKISSTLAGVLKPGLGDHVHCSVFRKYPENPPSADTMLAELGPYQDLLPVVNASIPASCRVVMAHQCTYAGRRFVHVTMRRLDSGALVSLVIARRISGENFAGLDAAIRIGGTPVYQGTAGKYQIAGFDAGGYVSFVVSELTIAENLNTTAALLPGVSEVLANIL